MRALQVVACVSLLVVQAFAAECACSGSRPCQHVSGTTCYALTRQTEFEKVVQRGGRLACPPSTIHCSCDCNSADGTESAGEPCQEVTEDGGVQCVPTVDLYGKQVCPSRATHCLPSQSPAPAPAHWASGAAKVAAQVGDGTDLICRCTGSRPCLVGSGTDASFAFGQGACTMMVGGVCPAGTTRCQCGCNTAEAPCQSRNDRDLCLPGEQLLSDGTFSAVVAGQTCPPGTIKCVLVNDAPSTSGGAVPDAECRCGGGKPCQRNDDMSGDKCIAMTEFASGVRGCPADHTECNCNCKDTHPCLYRDRDSGASFCFALDSTTKACPADSKQCNAFAGTVTIESSNAAAPAPAPHTAHVVHVSASMLATKTPTPAPTNSSNGAHNCLFDGWSNWSKCSRKCGPGGVKRRSARVTQPAGPGGAPCPADQETTCNTDIPCVNVDCVQDQGKPWYDWTPCTRDCGGGKQYQKPRINKHAEFYGRPCPPAHVRSCNTQPCVTQAVKACNCSLDDGHIEPLRAEGGEDPSPGELSCRIVRKHHDDSTETPEWHGQVISVFHPNKGKIQSQADNIDTQGLYHRCGAVGDHCKCCTCAAKMCQETPWSAYSNCTDWAGPEKASDGSVLRYRTRTRTFAQKVHDGSSCPVAEERDFDGCYE